MTTAAVIINYNDSVRVVNLAEKLLGFDFFDWIVISDNNSSAEQLEILNRLADNPKVKLLLNGKNLWFTGGNNAGLKWLADKNIDYVYTLNSDVDLERELLVQSAEYLDRHGDVAIVSAQMMEGGELKQNYYNFPTVRGAISENLLFTKIFGIKPKPAKEDDGIIEADYIRSSYWAVRYSDFSKVDFFDENVFLYHAETCVGIKLSRIGKKSVILKDWQYIHNHIYKKGYKMTGYKDTYRSLKYIFKAYYKKNAFQMFFLKLSYLLGLAVRKIFLH